MGGLWFFGIIVIVIYAAFCKVKYDVNIFNIIVILCSIFWVVVLPVLCFWFMITIFWDSLQLIIKKIIKRKKPIDSSTKATIRVIKEIVFEWEWDG